MSRCFREDHNIARIIGEARRQAHAKHGDNSIESVPAYDARWLPILVEEVGELAHSMTYDTSDNPEDLANELVDILAVASAWLDSLMNEGIKPKVVDTVWLA